MYQRIRDLREDNDLTQKEVAIILSFTHSAYAKIERGGKNTVCGSLNKNFKSL